MTLYLVQIFAGIVMLTLGGEALIRGAVAAARRFRVSPLLSGLVIVGFGTSAPELVVSVDAAAQAQPDIAMGNVVGSNIGNILLILGLCALISPMSVQPLILRRDGVIMVLSSVLLVVLIGGKGLSATDSMVLLGALVGYLAIAYWSEKKHSSPASQVYEDEAKEIEVVPDAAWRIILFLVAGLALLLLGSQVLLKGAVGLAQHFAISEAVIGLTLVAVGTSLPELSVSLIAALRRHADVAIGNVLGSNIFNILGILGISAFLQPLPAHSRVLQFDLWILLASAFVLLFFLFTGRRLSRLEGGILLSGYIAYLILSFKVYGS
ncbi:calcium/sodium antiporter [Pseudoalteromonas sp. R3]|uniref:calcium/sodium antiporter n=1 Tax=Pseudoalteromonas sp. R3 TaxID=1709477 RepID=UPI0006B509FA|nr:calcium/sodium antiporter [Pseudoalteromonas sp. R3]AZZ98149.1 calcium/sodium antiporter [Pseudoalteromonas sp. R3]